MTAGVLILVSWDIVVPLMRLTYGLVLNPAGRICWLGPERRMSFDSEVFLDPRQFALERLVGFLCLFALII